jgi:hypothetical protein
MSTATRCRFPSTEWFEALGEEMTRDHDLFRKFGWIDTTAAIVLQAGGGLAESRAWLLTFGPYTLDNVTEISPEEAGQADFSLVAPYPTWKEMVGNIASNDGADLKHTINYLHFGQVDLRAADQLKADIFFRVNGSLQAYLDKAARVTTDFAA